MSVLLLGAQSILSLTASSRMSPRRHTDPPKLWVSVIVGSIAIHLLALWILKVLMVRQQNVDIGTEPMPIELIGDAPQASSVTLQTTPENQATSPSSAQKTHNEDSTEPKSPVVSKSMEIGSKPEEAVTSKLLPSHTPKPEASEQTFNPPQASPKAATGNHEGIAPTPVTTGSPQPTQDVPTRNEPPQMPTSTATATPASNSIPSPPPENVPNKNELPQTSTPTASAPPTSGSNHLGENPQPLSAPAISSTSQTSNLPGIVATLSNFRSANRGRDVPDKLAEPNPNQQVFASILYPTKLRYKADHVLILKVELLITDTGTVEKVLPAKDSVDSEQLALASEILKDWKFEPASQAGLPVYSLLDVVLTIKPRVG